MMKRRDFIVGAGAALAGCVADKTGGMAADGIRTVRQEDPAVQAAKSARLSACRELGPTMSDVEERRTKRIPGKRAAFYIDDVIFCFQDLARDRPKSIWDHFYFAAFREAHEKYGLKVQMNIFYRGDFFYGMDSAKFTLKDMPDIWKGEFQAAKDWLRFGFHSYSEFPDYSWINASYPDVWVRCAVPQPV